MFTARIVELALTGLAVPIKQCYNWNESSDISGHITARSLNNDI